MELEIRGPNLSRRVSSERGCGIYLSCKMESVRRGSEKFASALCQKGIQLRKLYMCKNRGGDAGAAALADALTRNRYVTQLRLRDCDIGDEGCEALATPIRRNDTLLELFMQENSRITAIGSGMMETSLQHSNYMLTTVPCGVTNNDEIDRLCAANRRLKGAFAEWKSDCLQRPVSLGLCSRGLEFFETKPDLVYSILQSLAPELFQARRTQRKRKCPDRLQFSWRNSNVPHHLS